MKWDVLRRFAASDENLEAKPSPAPQRNLHTRVPSVSLASLAGQSLEESDDSRASERRRESAIESSNCRQARLKLQCFSMQHYRALHSSTANLQMQQLLTRLAFAWMLQGSTASPRLWRFSRNTQGPDLLGYKVWTSSPISSSRSMKCRQCVLGLAVDETI